MNSEQSNYMIAGIKNNKQKFLGEGSYGCTLTPGLDCKGKINKYYYKLNKIQEVDFNSKNEIEISQAVKKITGFKKRFVPVSKYCIVKFNNLQTSKDIINNCENLFGSYSKNDDIYFINKEYYMFYMRYIKGSSPNRYLLQFDNINHFYNKFYYSFYYLLNSIYLLNKNKIVHNDLHYNNIIYDINNDIPYIIDFGLSFKYEYLFKLSKGFDYYYIKKLFFDWRENMWWWLSEKKFISFIIYNKSNYYQVNVNSDFTENTLTENILDIFINDVYYSFTREHDINFIFNNQEIQEFYKILKNFYYKFLPINDKQGKYKYYSSIIKELLPFVLKYNDLHTLASSYIQIIYNKLNQEINFKNFSSSKYIVTLDFIKSLIKKVYYPDPYYRLSTYQFISIFNFVFNFCKSIDVKDLKNNKYIDKFNLDFKSLLNDINYSYDLFFNKSYAYIDFDLILSKDNIMLIKNFDFQII